MPTRVPEYDSENHPPPVSVLYSVRVVFFSFVLFLVICSCLFSFQGFGHEFRLNLAPAAEAGEEG